MSHAKTALAAAVATWIPLWAQAPKEAFEVAAIKPLATITLGTRTVPRAQFHYIHASPADPLRGIAGNRFTVPYATLTDLIMDAYYVRLDQVAGAPAWATQDGDMYQIEAKAPGDGVATSDQVRAMLQSLLADRFQLKLRRETRNLPVYELTIAKGGPKVKEVPPNGRIPGKTLILGIISNFLDHPLIDKTGLDGANYKFDWDQTELLDELKLGKPAPSIFHEVQEQLGLKLEAKSAPTEVLIVENAEKPSDN